MPTILRQSTEIKVRIGPFVDVGDGVTPETGITLAAADEAELLKADGAATVDISAATWAAITSSDGWYDLTLTTSHTDTVGELVVVVQDASVCLPVYQRFQVVEEAVYDNQFGSSAVGPLAADNNGSGLTEAGGDGDHLTAINLPNQTMDITGNITGNLSGSVGSVTGAVGSVTGSVGSVVGHTPQTGDTFAKFAGITLLAEWLGAIAGKQVADATAITEIRATGAGSGTFDETTDSQEAIRDTAPLGTAMRGTDSAALASVCTEARLAELDAANIPADVDAVVADTNELQTDWADGGRLDLILDAVNAAWTTALTEAYRSTGATGTPAQLLYEIMAHVGEFALSGTTKTLKKLDGSTTAKTYTLDDASSPTSITETT